MMETIIKDIDDQEAFEKEEDEEHDELRHHEKAPSGKNIERDSHVHAMPADKGVAESRAAFDKMTFPMTPRERLNFHTPCSLLACLCTIASIFKARSWCVQPGTLAKVQLFTFTYSAIFWFAAGSSAKVQAWVIREFEGKGWFPKWMVNHFENIVVMVGQRTLTRTV
jgi:hypothetical protein